MQITLRIRTATCRSTEKEGFILQAFKLLLTEMLSWLFYLFDHFYMYSHFNCVIKFHFGNIVQGRLYFENENIG